MQANNHLTTCRQVGRCTMGCVRADLSQRTSQVLTASHCMPYIMLPGVYATLHGTDYFTLYWSTSCGIGITVCYVGLHHTAHDYIILHGNTLHYMRLQYTVLHYIILHGSASHCMGLLHTMLDYITLHVTISHCMGHIILHCTTSYCMWIHYTAWDYIPLYWITSHCMRLNHTACDYITICVTTSNFHPDMNLVTDGMLSPNKEQASHCIMMHRTPLHCMGLHRTKYGTK